MSIPEPILRQALESVTGQPVVLAQDLDWDMKAPCSDCPFAKASAFHQGICRSLPGYLEVIERGHFAHSCHQTDPRPEVDGPRTFKGTPKHCYGALMTLLKSGEGADLQQPLIQAIDAGKLDIHALDAAAKKDEACFTLDEMRAFYAAELKRRYNLKDDDREFWPVHVSMGSPEEDYIQQCLDELAEREPSQ